MLGWFLFLALLVWFFASMIYSHKRRLYLRNYIVYLLINDEIRGDHKFKFIEWARSVDVKDAMDLSQRAYGVIENMAAQLSATSTLAAYTMIWKVRS
jgi:hypothetical protein